MLTSLLKEGVPKNRIFPDIRKYSETEDFFHSRVRPGLGFSNFSYYFDIFFSHNGWGEGGRERDSIFHHFFVSLPNTVIVIL